MRILKMLAAFVGGALCIPVLIVAVIAILGIGSILIAAPGIALGVMIFIGILTLPGMIIMKIWDAKDKEK